MGSNPTCLCRKLQNRHVLFIRTFHEIRELGKNDRMNQRANTPLRLTELKITKIGNLFDFYNKITKNLVFKRENLLKIY